MKQNPLLALALVAWLLSACNSPSNERAVKLEDLEKTQAEDAEYNAALAPSKDALTASELLSLSDCASLQCVQLFMKDHSNDFIHATKGEFAALHRSTVTDTAGHELIMPLSTLYIDVNPQASWRMAHTLHRKDQADLLLEDFSSLGFIYSDSGYYLGIKSKQARYLSPNYPGKTLYVTSTFQPWRLKGLYKNVTWPCFVFEVYNR